MLPARPERPLALNPTHPLERTRGLFSLLYTFLAQMGHREDYRNRLSEMSRARQNMIATDIAQCVPEPRRISPEIAAALLQGLLHGLNVQLMIDPNAFDRQAMFEACTQLLAPMFTAVSQETGDRSQETGDSDT